MTAHPLRLFLPLACVALLNAAPAEVQPGDLVILNGNVVDGTGAPARVADVQVRDGRIVAVEEELGTVFPEGVTVISAFGKAVSPGFIDTHSHGDPAETPEMHNFLAQGILTICLGQDGGSVSVGKMASWFDEVAAAKPGPNVCTFVGHGTVRDEAGVGLSTEPTDEQLQSMAALVDEALTLGAMGLTTGLEYRPGTFARENELAIIAQPVGKRGLTVLSHMRSEDDDQVMASIRELVNQCAASGANAHVSHIKSVYGKGAARAEEILAVLEESRGKGVRVTADIYPYTASYTGLAILFPDYALPPNNYDQARDEKEEELRAYLDQRVMKRNGPEATLLGSGEDAGKTLAQVAEEEGKHFADVLMEKGPRGGSAAYFVMDEELQSRLLVADGVNICTDGSPSIRHPRGYGSFARVLNKFVREDKALTLEQAIHKMSGLPAETTGLDKLGRGTLKPGMAADILIFDPAAVRDTATFSEPHQLAEGFDTILVNGVVVRQDGEFTGDRAGVVLKRAE